MTEQRRDDRFAVGLPVLLSWDDNGTSIHAEGTTQNVSDGGTALTCDASPLPPVGDTINVRVVNPGGGQVPTLEARVVRHTDDGLGLEFLG